MGLVSSPVGWLTFKNMFALVKRERCGLLSVNADRKVLNPVRCDQAGVAPV